MDRSRVGLLRRVKRRSTAAFLSWEEDRFERRFGMQTSGTVATDAVTVLHGEPSEGHAYVAEHPRITQMWMRAVADPSRFALVDLGSGKGRVLVLAADRGFASVIGVEYAKELHDEAVVNTSRFSSRVRLVLDDAGNYEYPLDPLLVHLNNPFGEDVMRHVIERLAHTYQLLPRPIVVVYQQAQVEDNPTRNVELLEAVPFLRPQPLRRSVVDRLVLKPWRVDVFRSPEADGASGPPQGAGA